MKTPTRIFLIGLPGSGKTTLAKKVAEQMQIVYFDLDDEIEKSTGKKVGDIFKSGEIEFRNIESKTLKALILSKQQFILATGGGAPCFNNNLEVMKNSGTTIFLDVPVNEICARISKQAINRPLLKGDLEERITTLYQERIAIYQQAAFTLSGVDIQSQQIVEIIR